MNGGNSFMRCARAAGAALLAAAAVVPGLAQDEPSWRTSGSATFSIGAQQGKPDSIAGPSGRTDRPSRASQKAGVILRGAGPAGISLLLDAQVEHLPRSDSTTERINQLNVAFSLGPALRLRLGRQRVLWGKGLTYIPTDFVNPPLDPLGLDLAKVGVTALSLDYVHAAYSLTALVRSEDERKLDSFGLKLSSSSLASGLDLDLIYYRSPSVGNALGASFALDVGQYIAPLHGLVLTGGAARHRKSRYPAVERSASNGVPYLVPGESGRKGRYLSWMLSGTYEFNERLSMTAEHYRIGDAYSGRDYGDIVHCLGVPASTCRGLSAGWYERLAYGRNQGAYHGLSLSVASLTNGHSRLTDTLGLQFGMLQGGEDRSRHFTVAVKSNFWDRTEIVWRNFLTSGSRYTEFGSAPYRWATELMLTIGF